jgi:hypothetical protein
MSPAPPSRNNRTILGVTHHARERMAEHYGRDLTREEWLVVVESIVMRTAPALSYDDVGGYVVYAVPAMGTTIRVIWRPDKAVIITVLGEDHANHRRVAGLHANARGFMKAATFPARFKRGKKIEAKTRWQVPRLSQDDNGGDE